MAAGGLAITAGDMACGNGGNSAKEGRKELDKKDLTWNGPVLKGLGPEAGGVAPPVGGAVSTPLLKPVGRLPLKPVGRLPLGVCVRTVV